jgi:regulator of telomere elongation helicase 1
VPYNYLFDKEARTTLEIQWNNAILIFDEAHNLESFASDATSFELTGLDIAGAINEVSKGIELVSNSISSYGVDDGIKVDNLVKLKAMFLRIEEFLDSVVPAQGGSFAGEYIFEAWRYASITYQNHQLLIDFTRKITEVITETHGGMSSGTPKLDHFIGCLRRTFGGTSEAQCLAKARSYRVHVTPHKKLSNDYSKNNAPRTLSYWCFAPSLAMRELVDLGLRSIIVTSGTLSPIKSYSLTLGIPFHVSSNSLLSTLLSGGMRKK